MNNTSGVNTILLVVVLIILVGGGIWWYEAYGPGAQSTSQPATTGVQVNVGATQNPQPQY